MTHRIPSTKALPPGYQLHRIPSGLWAWSDDNDEPLDDGTAVIHCADSEAAALDEMYEKHWQNLVRRYEYLKQYQLTCPFPKRHLDPAPGYRIHSVVRSVYRLGHYGQWSSSGLEWYYVSPAGKMPAMFYQARPQMIYATWRSHEGEPVIWEVDAFPVRRRTRVDDERDRALARQRRDRGQVVQSSPPF